MDLTIILPVYQTEQYIHACMESIYGQGLDEQRFEVIIVDDGTKDNSLGVIKDIISQHDNITVIHQENQGLSGARNTGITVAKGEYFIMPDSDDMLIENSLQPLLDKALDTKADLIVADFLRMSDEEIESYRNTPSPPNIKLNFIEKTGPRLYMEDIMPNEYYVWRTLFRREFVVNNNIRFYPGITFQDVPFTQECYLRAGKCLRAYWPMSIYRRGHSSASSPATFSMKKAHDFCLSIAQVWKLKNIGLPPELNREVTNNAFISYNNLLHRTLFLFDKFSDKVAILKMLKKEVPDLCFTNNWKQIVHTVLLKTSPQLHIIFFMIIKKIKWK